MTIEATDSTKGGIADAVAGGATYTFGIWVQGHKADSYREFKHTVRNPGGCINTGGWIWRAWRGEYVCDYGNPDKP